MRNAVEVAGAKLYYLRVETRVPLKFGAETLTQVTCARVELTVRGLDGREATGWGETPLNVQWVWPGALPYEARLAVLKAFCERLCHHWPSFDGHGHALDVGHGFIEGPLHRLLGTFNRARSLDEPMPWLAALLCNSAFDIALHDAYGNYHGLDVYETYNGKFVEKDLASYLAPLPGCDVIFRGKYPADFLEEPEERLPVWHLVGGADPIDDHALTGSEPEDAFPILLRDWIRRDGLRCLKVKLRGDDPAWDYARLVRVGEIGVAEGVDWLSADFNCTAREPAYVNAILDRIMREHPRIYGMILYVEQPFPYDLETHRIDVRSVSARKPLFLDESAHDWRMVRLGRELGWSGVALKTCKTQTGALLSLCWAKAHGMTVMVQDLTNPMLAQIPHVRLAAHAGTIMGVESNAMQFYPDASAPEAAVHPGLYTRRGGMLDLSSIGGPGFGYRLDQIQRDLPKPAASHSQ